MQAKGLIQFTSMKPANLDKEALEKFCTPMKNATKEAMGLVQRCHPEALKKARALCWGDGKGDKGDGKDGDGKDDDKKGDDKGDGKGDDEGDGKNQMCASFAEQVRSRCVHVQVAG